MHIIFIHAIFSNSFTVNHPLSLLGFRVYGSERASDEYEVSIELSQAGKVVGRNILSSINNMMIIVLCVILMGVY